MGLRWERAQYWQLDRFRLQAWELLTDIDDLREQGDEERGGAEGEGPFGRLAALAARWASAALAWPAWPCNRQGFILVGAAAHRRSVVIVA